MPVKVKLEIPFLQKMVSVMAHHCCPSKGVRPNFCTKKEGIQTLDPKQIPALWVKAQSWWRSG